ncbi:tumor necrosis factor receptor superfamily member 17 isoform X3 [Marmota marmota marmota]|uniref:tumor necrosis factor receptor superfamily member 17 isoform X3 n=1 Tax=Marmota marmota marmota TaxID=9994 RepID=UPI0020936433|nr:tumor necrosis factor receptor superfamily member 17 isoform X3 [Marmota marmota marmota]
MMSTDRTMLSRKRGSVCNAPASLECFLPEFPALCPRACPHQAVSNCTGNGKFPTHADRKAIPERPLGGSVLLDVANADLDKSRTREDTILPRSLGYTVEECTCQDCVKSKPKVDSDHVFPLPAMEEGATILVTTKTNDYCKSLPAASGVTGTERSTSTR